MRERDSREAAGSRHEHMKIKTFGLESFSLDKESISVRYLEQLTDTEQTTALAYLLRFCLEQTLDGKRTVSQAVRLVYDTLNKKGWEPFCPAVWQGPGYRRSTPA